MLTYKIGGAEEDRTLDFGIANAALSQLSYSPIEELNPKEGKVAGWTGVEPAAYGVTGRRYNQT